MNLIRYEAAKQALAEYKSVDEVKDFRDKAVAVKAYAQQAGDKQLEIDAAEARLRSERRLGELMKEMPKAPAGRPKGIGLTENPIKEAPALADLGIDKNLAHAARTAAEIPEQDFEEILGTHREQQQAVTASTLSKMKKAHVTHNSGENEWYTPPVFIESARTVLGEIDLDPASSKVAQKTVQAKRYYTKENSALNKKWEGSVWMNPPYSKSLLPSFVERFLQHIESEDITEAIVLVNNATDTQWFQELASSSNAVCFPSGRIKFHDASGAPVNTPLQGQAFLYFGACDDKFCEEFSKHGFCLEVPA